MGTTVACGCGAKYSVSPETLGKNIRCKQCGAVFLAQVNSQFDPLASSAPPMARFPNASRDAKSNRKAKTPNVARLLFPWGIRLHWVAQSLILGLVLLQAITVVGLLLQVEFSADSTPTESWQMKVADVASSLNEWNTIGLVVVAFLDILGCLICLSVRNPVVTMVLVSASLACKVAIPGVFALLRAADAPLWIQFAALVVTIWLAWILLSLALYNFAIFTKREDLMNEGMGVMVLGTTMLAVMGALVVVVIFMLANYEGAILLALLAFAAYVICVVIFCLRYMNFLSLFAAVAEDRL